MQYKYRKTKKMSKIKKIFKTNMWLPIVISCASFAFSIWSFNVNVNGERPYIKFTPSIKNIQNATELMELKINVGNYGRSAGIIDFFVIKIGNKSYHSDHTFLWTKILEDNGIPKICTISITQGWLPKHSVLKSNEEEENFLKIIFSPMNEENNNECIKPLIDLLKSGKITYELNYHSPYEIKYSESSHIQYDFSSVMNPVLLY